MQFIRRNLSALRPVRFLVAAFICTTLLFANAFPALAIGSTPSHPNKGEARLQEIQDKSERVLMEEPRTSGELEREARGGLNTVQGGADIDKMSRPENSQQATSAEQQVEKGLKKATGRD